LKSVVLRITNPYGPFQRPEQRSYGVINQFIHKAVRGQPITLFGAGEQLRDYVHVDDVAAALMTAATSPAAVNGTFNVGSGHGTSMAELARLIVQVAGTGTVENVEWPKAEAQVETGNFVADIGSFAAATGWTPKVALRVGLEGVVSQETQRRRNTTTS
jgi:UDP-glucose 4-epimerase